MLKTLRGCFYAAGILLLLAVFIIPAQVSAQDFGQLLEAVDKLEANLKALVEKESAARQSQFANLQAQLDQAPQASGNDAWKKQLLKEVAILRTQVETMPAPTQSGSGVSDQQLVDLMTEVDVLREEIKLLQETGAASSSEQLVSSGEQDLILAFDGPAGSEEETGVEGLEISGFFDVVNTIQTSAEDKNQFNLGQAEIYLASPLGDRAEVEVAVAYNADDGLFELGAAVLGINMYEGEQFVSSIDIAAGQFDVPFGIDLNYYPSIERKLVTGPMAVAMTHGGWNDLGFTFNLETTVGNLVVYGVNGFESSAEVLDEVASLALGEDVFEEIDTSPANAVGTRVGITPVADLEIGVSFANGWNLSGRPEMSLVGADLQYSVFNFDFRGEYVSHTVNLSIAKETNNGWYFQSLYNFSRAFLAARYGSFQPDEGESVGQFTFGAGYAVVEAVELRFETLVNSFSDENMNTLQIVASF